MFLYLLKIVEIVIILSKENVGNETAGFKGFGKSRAHILCAVFAGCNELFHTVFNICRDICRGSCIHPRQGCDKSQVFSVVFDWRSYDSGRFFQARAATGPNHIRENKVNKRKNPTEAGNVNE